MENGSLDFLLHSETIRQFKIQVYKYCKKMQTMNTVQSVFTDLPQDLKEIQKMTIYHLAPVSDLLFKTKQIGCI